MKNNNTLFSLSYARFRFTLEAEEDAVLPTYLGSTLRGAMGHALRQLVCLKPGADCTRCMHRWQCAFVYVMATSRQSPDGEGKITNQALPHPYVIEPPPLNLTDYPKGEMLSFNLILIGSGILLLPLFISTFEKVGVNGLGKKRSRFVLQRVEQQQDDHLRLLWAGGNHILEPPQPIGFKTDSEEYAELTAVTLQLQTPLRLVDKGRLDDSPDFSVLMRAVFRRLDALGKIHGQGGLGINFRSYLEMAAQVQPCKDQTRWHDWERFSSTQDAFMKLGGLLGEITYTGKLAPFLPYLKMAEILHAGKGSSFGLGQFKIVI